MTGSNALLSGERNRVKPGSSSQRAARPIPSGFLRKDGWFYSVGVEYVATPTWTVRGGVGFEQSPVTDQVRIPLLPDNDRTWYSVGATNKVTNIISVNLVYSFVDVKNATLNVVPGNPSFNGLVTYTGTAKTSISIFSLGVKFKLDDPPAAGTHALSAATEFVCAAFGSLIAWALPGRFSTEMNFKVPSKGRDQQWSQVAYVRDCDRARRCVPSILLCSEFSYLMERIRRPAFRTGAGTDRAGTIRQATALSGG